MKFGLFVELLFLIPNIPIFQNRPSRTEVECLKTATFVFIEAENS